MQYAEPFLLNQFYLLSFVWKENLYNQVNFKVNLLTE